MITATIGKADFARASGPELNNERGAASGSFDNQFYDGDKNTGIIKIEDYRKMIDNDGTADALYKLIKYPILANGWRIDPDPLAPEEAAQEQANFVDDNFVLPPHKGGMTTPFRLVIGRCVRGVLEGYQIFEKVWTISPAGKFIYRKIAPRDSLNVSVVRDAKGGFSGYKQTYYDKDLNKTITVELKPEECFLYTHQKDEDEVFGKSAFRAAYFHYDRKHRLYRLYEKGVQVAAIPPKVVKVQDGNEDTASVQSSNLATMAKLGVSAAVLVPKGYDLEPYDTSKGRIDPIQGIDHHNAEMARSQLASFILLGTQSKNGGSYALSESGQDIFSMALRGVMNEMEEQINAYLIPQLIDYNFETKYYPEFHFNDMTDDTREFLENIFTEIVKKSESELPESFLNGLIKQVAERLGVEMDEEDTIITKKSETTDNSRASKKKEFSAVSDSWRDLTPAEQSISLAAIEKKLDTLEAKFIEDITPLYESMRDNAIRDIRPVLESGKIEDLNSLEIKGADAYSKALYGFCLESYTASKKQAADEIEENIPATTSAAKAFFKQNAQDITAKQESDILYMIKSRISNAINTGQLSKHEFDATSIESDIYDDFDAFFQKIELTGSVLTSQSLNRGRKDVFDTHKSKIAVYQYSALLDSRTCPLCNKLDRTIVEYDDYSKGAYEPPQHFMCRCIWIAIKNDQTEIPQVTGYPDLTEEIAALRLFNNDNISVILSAEGAHKH